MSSDYSISDAAKAAGCTPAELRIWTERYGWPQPSRDRHGWRSFAPTLVADLQRVVALRNAGTPIGAIIGTGRPVFPGERIEAHRIDLSGLPEPSSQDGRELCLALASSIQRGLSPSEVRHIAEVRLSRVRPTDRGAVLALVKRYEEQRSPVSAA